MVIGRSGLTLFIMTSGGCLNGFVQSLNIVHERDVASDIGTARGEVVGAEPALCLECGKALVNAVFGRPCDECRQFSVGAR